MKAIALVTDSCADLSPDFIKENNIYVVPLRVKFAGKEYRDGVDLSPGDFYKRLASSAQLPKTSQPSVEDFITLYRRLLEEHKEVISIHLSSRLSGTFNVANLAKETIKGSISVFDSRMVSLGIGLLILEALAGIKEGSNSLHIIENLKRVRHGTETIFCLDTLKYLYKGGRIGRAASLMGTIMRIKPLLGIKDGEIVPLGKLRSKGMIISKIKEMFQEIARGREPLRLAVAHAHAPESGQKLKAALEEMFGLEAELFGEIGPTLGVHGGPGVLGAALSFD